MTTNMVEMIAAQLERLSHEEVITLVRDFAAGLDEEQQRRFLLLVQSGPRPLVAESMGLDEVKDLLGAIRKLHKAIENDEYVEYGAGYDPDYGEYRGFGDDGWIEEMDKLFDAATSLFRAGQWKGAADAYGALFHIFELNQDGYHFTHPEPAEALRTDVDAMKKNFFVAIGRSEAEPAATAIEQSDELHFYGQNRYALLDAWEGHEELMAALHAEMIDRARSGGGEGPLSRWVSHSADLLREFYRRYRTLPDYEWLCREVGQQQGWPYQEMVTRYREQANWERVLAWADEGLQKLAAQSGYRPLLEEARGEALLRLDRPAEAAETLLALFRRQWTAPVYLKLREAARAAGQWEALWPELAEAMRARVPAQAGGVQIVDVTGRLGGSPSSVAGLLGYAYLLEGAWREAVAWASDARIPPGYGDDDLPRIVATGLLRMVAATRNKRMDDVLAQQLANAPALVREYGNLLEAAATGLPVDPVLDGAVQLYERLVDRGIAGRSRPHYAEAGAACKVIRAIRIMQGKRAEFEDYYQGLLSTYTRLSALKDELRTAIEGPGYKRKR